MSGEKRTGNAGHAIATLAERQHGVVARSQLRGLGLRDGAIDDRIAWGYLQPLFRGTFAVGHRAISREGRMLAAVLACESGTPVAFQRDRLRDQILIAAGYRTARVTWRQVVDEPTAVVDRIARMLKPK